jgi:hypothetical protein
MRTLRRHERSALRKRKLQRLGKRGCKRGSPALDTKAEAEAEAEANSQEEEAGLSVPKNKMARIGEVEPTGALWRALVAKMY